MYYSYSDDFGNHGRVPRVAATTCPDGPGSGLPDRPRSELRRRCDTYTNFVQPEPFNTIAGAGVPRPSNFCHMAPITYPALTCPRSDARLAWTTVQNSGGRHVPAAQNRVLSRQIRALSRLRHVLSRVLSY